MVLDTQTQIDPLDLLTRDLKRAAATLTEAEARYLVDYYYTMQDDRKRAHNQVRALRASEPEVEPHDLILWVAGNTEKLEDNIKKALGEYSDSKLVGVWAKSIIGIGPVIAAGLLAHLDRLPETVGSWWRFAGLDPTQVWEPKTKRPFNAQLKTLCWKIGESFVKFSNHEKDVYGKVYAARKEVEIARNESGMFADQAAAKLVAYKIGKDTDAYKAYSNGILPPAHIHSRAKRYAVKLFLASYHEVAFFIEYGKMPPKPYILNQRGHTHYYGAPNAALVPGLQEAQETQGAQPLSSVLSETREKRRS